MTTALPSDTILTNDAVAFLEQLHRTFNERRLSLLADRLDRQARIDAGELPDFLESTRRVRQGVWTVAGVPMDLMDRRVEITGPVDRKMMINALNSRARTFMADFEDSLTPSFENVLNGQLNAYDAVRGTISFQNQNDKPYTMDQQTAVLLIRPRGWHLPERNLTVDGEPMSGSLVDFGLYMFHNARELVERGSGPYFYLPKLESHFEARLWNDVFVFAQNELGLPVGTVKATVLIETILAVFEMDEILYELRDHSVGLNAGRWDYIFSIIKKFRNDPTRVLPDRSDIVMTVGFMQAYTDLLIQTCHKRGAHAIGGMAAFIPNRNDPEVTAQALVEVAADKRREAMDGFDGTWVAHPGLVEVAMDEFDAVLGERPNQLDKLRTEVAAMAGDLINTEIPNGAITLRGIRTNVNIGILYIASWLCGNGAAALYNLMEDAATAEISRSQIWQWVQNGSVTVTGEVITSDLVRAIVDEEMDSIAEMVGVDALEQGRYAEARIIFEQVTLDTNFVEFLTLPAYAAL